jgi:hypothetical protein
LAAVIKESKEIVEVIVEHCQSAVILGATSSSRNFFKKITEETLLLTV